jgi:hypothetical protein
MRSTELRQLIRESINEYIREIDAAGDKAALEAKMAKTQEAIEARTKKIEMSETLEEMKDMVDPVKIKTLKSEIKSLEKTLNKYKKQLDKVEGKASAKKEKPEDKEVVTEEEPTNEMDMEMDMEEPAPLNESFLRMQKLAGIITENKYNKLTELFLAGKDLKFGDVAEGEKYVAASNFGPFKQGDNVNVDDVRTMGQEVVLKLSTDDNISTSIKGDLEEEVEVFARISNK